MPSVRHPTLGVIAALVTTMLAACASATDTPAPARKTTSDDYVTGSNLPRRGSAAANGVTQASPDALPRQPTASGHGKTGP